MEYQSQLFANIALQTDIAGIDVEVFLQHPNHKEHSYKRTRTCLFPSEDISCAESIFEQEQKEYSMLRLVESFPKSIGWKCDAVSGQSESYKLLMMRNLFPIYTAKCPFLH